MTDQLVLTFAEIEFMLRLQQPNLDVRELLRFRPEATGDVVAAAGLASLLARELCADSEGKVRAGQEITAVSRILTTADVEVDALGWIGEEMVLLHVFSSPDGQLACRPCGRNLFTVEALEAGAPLSAALVRLLDLCLTGDGESAVLMRLSTTAGEPISLAVARGADGGWNLSDSTVDGTISEQVTPEQARGRVVELFGGDSAALGATQ